jgi:hypothetical protein
MFFFLFFIPITDIRGAGIAQWRNAGLRLDDWGSIPDRG